MEGRTVHNFRMNMSLKVMKIDSSAGMILPKELLAQIRVGPGGTLYVTEAPDGIRITDANPDCEAKMALSPLPMPSAWCATIRLSTATRSRAGRGPACSSC